MAMLLAVKSIVVFVLAVFFVYLIVKEERYRKSRRFCDKCGRVMGSCVCKRSNKDE